MPQSRQFTSPDVQAMIRLSGELRDIGPDFAARARHMLQGLCKLVSAQVALACDLHDYLSGRRWKITPLLDLGWNTVEERSWNMRFFEGPQLDDPMTLACTALADAVVTRSRRQLVADRDWYRSPNVQELRRRAHIDDCIYSNYQLGQPGRAVGIAFHRPWGDRPFSQRDVAVIDAFHRACPLYRLPGPPPMPSAGLTPRQSDVLSFLHGGDSEKQIAARLGLSAHTVHVHVKSIYRHFQVNSRGELMSLWLRQGL